MTTMTVSRNTHNRNGFARFLLLAVLMAALVYLCAHAIEKHGDDARTVRQCMNDQGPFAVWLQRDGCSHNLVKLPDGRTGDQIQIKGEDGRVHEVTSLIPRKGILEKIENNWRQQNRRQCFDDIEPLPILQSPVSIQRQKVA